MAWNLEFFFETNIWVTFKYALLRIKNMNYLYDKKYR